MKRDPLAVSAVLVAACLAAAGGSAAAKQVRVGLVVYSGVVPSSRTIEGGMFTGFLRADRDPGVQGRVLYIPPSRDPSGPLRLLAQQRYDLIITGFPGPIAEVDRIARQFPRIHFFMPDLPIEALAHRPKNVQGSDYRAGEAGYLAGYLAALMDDHRAGKHVISAVGGIPLPGVDRWIVGYKAGAKKADPAIAVRVGYSMDFVNPAKCRRLALSQIAAGSGVVFNVAGVCGLGALGAAKEEGVWGIGVDIDQSYLGPHILTSAVLRLDRGVFGTIGRLKRGTLTTGGNTVFDLRNGGVELGKISPKVPRSFLLRLESVRKAIVAGRIRVPRA
jgi:basic membrane protein A